MKKKLILLSATVVMTFSSISLACRPIKATASSDQSFSTSLIPNAVVRRKWVTGVLQTFTTGYAPKTIFYSAGGFAGTLTLYTSYKDNNTGVRIGYYEGYMYNERYPVPMAVPSNTIDDDFTVNAVSSKLVRRVVTKKNIWDLTQTIMVRTSSYAAVLNLKEYWQNRDGSWTGVYEGYAQTGNIPLENPIFSE